MTFTAKGLISVAVSEPIVLSSYVGCYKIIITSLIERAYSDVIAYFGNALGQAPGPAQCLLKGSYKERAL